MHQSQRTVTSRSVIHTRAFGGERAKAPKRLPLCARHLRLAIKFIDFYAMFGSRPTIKWICHEVYGCQRETVWRDLNRLVEAGILKRDPRYGARTLRPAPEYRLPFADEVALPNGATGAMVGKLKQQLRKMEEN
jgi:hypothetical protein